MTAKFNVKTAAEMGNVSLKWTVLDLFSISFLELEAVACFVSV